uniref:Uncharacterized protein n=1 Tax=Peronospora matthiolae TaxID=2874970 RepID=A0AAV1VJY6_9STRA
MPRAVRQRPGLEESSAPDDLSSRRANEDEERKSEEQHDTPTSSAFWHASANAVEAAVDFSEPSTFEEAVSGQDQVHCVEKTAAVKKTPRQAASSVEASGRPSFAIPVGTGMYQ